MAEEEAKRQQEMYNIPTAPRTTDSARHEARFFTIKLKYKNDLPPVPYDPKLLAYPLDPLRHVRYARTSLDAAAKTQLHPEPDLGMPLDLVDLERYNVPMLGPWHAGARRSWDMVLTCDGYVGARCGAAAVPPLAEADAKLADDDVDKLDQLKKLQRTRATEPAAVEVPWLRRTEYIANVLDGGSGNKADACVAGTAGRAGILAGKTR
jgi:hypothetical protein